MASSPVLDVEPPPPLSVFASAALLGSALLIFVGLFALAPALPPLQSAFATEPSSALLIQLVGATSSLTFAVGSLFVGRIVSRVGYRPVYLVALIVFAVSGSMAALSGSLIAIVATRALVGLATAAIVNAALAAIGLLLPSDRQARALGLQAMIGASGAVAAYPLISQLAAWDWRLAFAVHLLALLFVPLVLALPTIARSEAPSVATGRARGVGPLMLLAIVFFGMVVFIGTIFGPLFLASVGITEPVLLALPPTAGSAGSTLGSAIYGRIRHRLSVSAVFAMVLVLAAAGLAIAALTANVWGVALGCFVVLFGGGLFVPNMNAAAIAASPVRPAPTLGLVNALLYGSMVLFPLIFSQIADALGGPRYVLLGYALVAALFAAAFVIAGKREADPHPR